MRATGLLDSEVEEVFDRLTRLAVRLLGVPASFISLVDAQRDFYKSACGFGEPLASVRELTGPTFCHFTVQRTDPLIIPDTAADPLYQDVPTVRTLGVAAYVGVPLVVDGQTVGAFCTIDTSPRDWTSDEVEILVELAASAQREMELRGAVSSARAASAVLQQAYSDLKESNARLEDQARDMEHSNDQLQQQALELELQAEELQVTTTHLEERTEAAERANESKVTFLSMMSHELRTPLNAIGGYSELIAMGIRGAVTPETIDYLSRIRRASRHLQTLIGDILEFAHLDAGRATYEIEDVPVNVVLDEAAELLGPQISEAGVTFHQDNCIPTPGGEQCLVRADPKRLRQILVNLLTNAVKFTPLAGHVTLGAELRDGTMRIRVADTGRGIPESEWTRIFEPFVQIDRTTTAAGNQGVGLGLPISRQLARGMNGELTLTSEAGSGSTFTLVLPAA